MLPRKKTQMAAETSASHLGRDRVENWQKAKMKRKTKVISLKEKAEKFQKEVQKIPFQPQIAI